MAAILFPYRPIGTIVERWAWNTDLIEAKDGKETRRAVREVPRLWFEWDVLVTDRVYNSLVRAQHSLTFKVPIWQEGEVTTSQITAGASTVAVDTDVGDWRTSFIIWASETSNEVLDIDSVGSDIINIDGTVGSTYAAGAVVAPIRTARLANLVRLRDDSIFSLLRLTWIVTDPTAFTAYDWSVQLLDDDVITDLYVKEGEFVGRTLQAAVEEYDFGTGEVGFEVQYDEDKWGMPAMNYEVFTPAEAWQWKTWFHKMQGRFGHFYLPTFKKDIILADDFTASDRWLTIENIGYVTYLDALTSNKYLLFQRPGNLDPLPRYITESAAVDSDTEQIRIDSNLGFAGTPESFTAISWLHACRLAADQVELAFSPGSRTTVSVPVIERITSLADIPDPDPEEYEIALYVAVTGTYADDYYDILTDLGWNVTIYADGTLPAVGNHDFDAIFAQGFGISQATNGALLRSYEAAGVPVLVGCSSGDMSSNFGSLLAEMGFATNSNSNSGSSPVKQKDPSFHQVAGHEILNGTTQDEETGEWSTNLRLGNPQAITTRDDAYGKKDYIWDDASPIGTTLAWSCIPTDDPGDRRQIGIIAIDAGEDGFTTRCLFLGHLQTSSADQMSDDGKALLHNGLKWILSDFQSFAAIPLTHSGLDTFALTASGSEFWKGANGSASRVTSVDPPNTYQGTGLNVQGTDQYIYSFGEVSGNWEFHCQWIYRGAGAGNNRFGFAWNCQINHQTGGGVDILDGYVFQLDNVDGAWVRYYAQYNDPPGEWVQASQFISGTSADWDGDVLYNSQLRFYDNLFQYRQWKEGQDEPPGAWGAGGAAYTTPNSGQVGLYIELGNPTCEVDISYVKLFTPTS